MLKDWLALGVGGICICSVVLATTPDASAQSCEQLCRTDPIYKITNQQRCLHAQLTGSCDSSAPVQRNPDLPSISAPRPTLDDPYYRSLGLPGNFEAMPSQQKRRIVEGRAQQLLDEQQQTMNQIDALMRIRPQDHYHEKILRSDLDEAYRRYDQTNRELQELRRVYEGDRPR